MNKYYQLKISLKGSKPLIYRNVLVNPELKLPELHDIIQTVMGWSNSHLHEFVINNKSYGKPDPDDDYEVINYKNIKIKDVLSKIKDKIKYEYDFGDYWVHSISLEKIVESEEKFNVKCIGGKNSCPPEDCGGIHGYYRLLDTIKNPEDKEDDRYDHYEEVIEWLGDDFDPNYFNVEEVNQALEFFNKK